MEDDHSSRDPSPRRNNPGELDSTAENPLHECQDVVGSFQAQPCSRQLPCDGHSHHILAEAGSPFDHLSPRHQSQTISVKSTFELPGPAIPVITGLQGSTHDKLFAVNQNTELSDTGPTNVPSDGSWSGATFLSTQEDWSELLSTWDIEDGKSESSGYLLANNVFAQGLTERASIPGARIKIGLWIASDMPWNPFNLRTSRNNDQEQRNSLFFSCRTFEIRRPINANNSKSDHSIASPGRPIFVPLDADRPTDTTDRLVYLLQHLNPRTNPSRVNNFFNGLDIILADLESRFPENFAVTGLSRALELISSIYHLNYAHNQLKVNQWTPIDLCSHTDTSAAQGPSAGQPRNTTQPYPPDQNQDPSSEPSPRDQNGTTGSDSHNNRIATSRGQRTRQRLRTRKLACPVDKHAVVHGHASNSRCNFPGRNTMSAIAQHLRGMGHRNDVLQIILCHHCGFYVTSLEEYRDVHNARRCQMHVQRRGARVVDLWQDLYRKIHPNSTRIPSPWTDDCGWHHSLPNALPDAVPTSTTPIPSAASGQPPPVSDHHSLPTDDPPFASETRHTMAPYQSSRGEPLLGNHATVAGFEPSIAPYPEQTPYRSSWEPVDRPVPQRGEAAYIEAIASIFQPQSILRGDLSDATMDQLLNHTNPEHVQRIADRLRDRAEAAMWRLQGSDPGHPAPTHASLDPSSVSVNGSSYARIPVTGVATAPNHYHDPLLGPFITGFMMPLDVSPPSVPGRHQPYGHDLFGTGTIHGFQQYPLPSQLSSVSVMSSGS
ncbi:hypothetical protein P154DRAFT_602509 [Amniculicola lignicola CBS 123094]|uniref:Uncharacterized protein n=1 Tax=Amniculicola lignicola CBS 123094 TaxID=1392246 RepID=A0A6A5WB77_9PLEO|nr:hypothetical protein P154DRAFT_602509 [Amniculicola lignicola CBS 123094]